MPILFGILGLILLITALNGTTSQLGTLVKGDFTGKNNFLVWAVALGVIGAVGYIPKARPVSNAFLVLVILGIILANQKSGQSSGLFAQFFNAVNNAGAGSGLPGSGSATSNDNLLSAAFQKISSGNFDNYLTAFGDNSNNMDTIGATTANI